MSAVTTTTHLELSVEVVGDYQRAQKETFYDPGFAEDAAVTGVYIIIDKNRSIELPRELWESDEEGLVDALIEKVHSDDDAAQERKFDQMRDDKMTEIDWP